MLVKATSDDSNPTPGYLYEDIKSLTFGSPGQTAALLDFLVERLEYRSCYVKLKVLNVMIRLVQKGHPDFAAGLRRRATGISQATMHSGPPHTLHDNAPYVAVRKAASELSTILFDTEKEADSTGSSMDTAGYGVNKSKTTMEGFGNTQPVQEKTFTDQIKNGIQQLTGSFSALEGSRYSDCSGKVYKAIPSSTSNRHPNNKSTYKGSLIGNTPDVGTAAGRREDKKPTKDTKVVQNPDLARITYKGGKAGGGWEDDGSSDGVSSGHSNGSVPLSEKLESAVVEDWNQEAKCVEDIVGSSEGRLIPSRQELDQLERRCNTLNCDQVLEFFIQKITRHENIIQMRALCAIERLLNTDLLGLVNETLQVSLQGVISAESTSKQAVSKAKKILRQIQNAVKQEELRNEPTPHQSRNAYAGQGLITTTSNESVFNDSKENYNLKKGLPTNLNESGQKNAIVDDHIGHKTDNYSVSLFDGLTMKADDSENGSNNMLEGTKESKANTLGNKLPFDAQVLDLHTEQNTVGNSSIVGNSVITTSVVVDSDVKESSSCSKEPCGCTRQESTKDPLLSRDNSIDYLLASMNFKMDGKRVPSSRATNDKIVMNQMSTTPLPQQQQSLDKDTITAMFPQLSTSALSGTSAIPLQLGKQNAGSFGFIANTTSNTRSKPKPQEKFDFVQEAMKSAIAK